RFNYSNTLKEIQHSHRTQAYSVAWKMVQEQPLPGIGTRQYHNRYREFANYKGAVDTPDSQYLRFLSENGFLGLIVFLGYMGYLIFQLFKDRNSFYGTGIFLSILSLSLGM